MIEKIGPYRVYERLGVGGMGEVYKAYDDRLDRWVAIKRIRPDREDSEDNRERFKREARATARLNHPSIVHLYGIFQEDESDCIVMEYVEGKSLDTILSEHPLDPLRVASLGHEIASGLAEAHSSGILHRDLKAENIIITSRGRAKILDFGLAKPILRDELDPVLTGKGQLVGTSRAMSPEYVSGEPVDHRSDLFSLGVLLYECLTGHSPFKAHNTLATLKQVMLHKQPSIVELDAKVPRELSDLIDRLLAKDPNDRPQSAHEVALEFGRLTGQISSGAVERPSSGGYLKASSTMTPFTASDTVLDLRPRRRWMTVAGVIALLLIAAFFFGRKFREPAMELDPTLEEGRQIRIVLGDFGNQTGEALLRETVGEAFRASLGQSRLNTLFSRSQIRDALSRMQRPPDAVIERDVGVEVSLREGAERLIMGQISKLGNSYSLTADVVDPQTDTTTYSAKETAEGKDEILNAIDRLSQKLRRNLGESIEQIQETARPLEKVTTPNLDALRAYSLGVEKVAEKKPTEAINFYERALSLDPGFAMAHAKLGVLYSNASNQEMALDHLDRALAKEDRLSEVEKFYVQGWEAIWRGTPEDVIEVWSLMSDLYPQVYNGLSNLGLAHWIFDNDFQKACEAFARAKTAAQGREIFQSAWHRGYCYLVLERSEEALTSFQAAANIEDGKKGLLDVAMATFAAASVTEAEVADLAAESDRLLYAGHLNLSRGAFTESIKNYDAVLRLGPQEENLEATFRALSGKAAALEQLDDTPALRDLASKTLAFGADFLQPSGLRTEQSPLSNLALVGKMLARRGEVEQANEIAAQLEIAVDRMPIAVWIAHLEILRGEIQLADGRPEQAFQSFHSALAIVSEFFAARESLAYRSGRLGLTEEEFEGLGWLLSRRGLAAAECQFSCFGREISLTQQTLAYFRSAEILFERGLFEEAGELYAKFLVAWDLAETDHPAVAQAKSRLEEIAKRSP